METPVACRRLFPWPPNPAADIISNMKKLPVMVGVCAAAGLAAVLASALGASEPLVERTPAKVAVVTCKGLIDEGLFKSIKRRTQYAIEADCNYLVYEIGTYGGLVEAADDISKYLIHEVAKRAHTAAYITSEAISAGALISVACRDIIMMKNTTIGDCAPIQLGGKIEGVEREKQESFVRAMFSRAAEANDHPELLLEAMVSMQVELYRVKNLETSEYEFFRSDQLPEEDGRYDVNGAELIAREDELLTLTDSEALEYGLAEARVNSLQEALDFLESRDRVEFASPPMRLEPNWSEQMVRWINSPAVAGVLFMIALLGLYIELGSPGLGLPGLVAAGCFAVIIGSKYLVGLANWLEVAVFVLGLCLLLVEFLVLPGFGIAGVAGIICVMAGLFGMLIKNPPEELPWPRSDFDWSMLSGGVLALLLGFCGFIVLAALANKFLPNVRFLSGLVLAPAPADSRKSMPLGARTGVQGKKFELKAGDIGIVTSTLRPAGRARFGAVIVDCVAEGAFIEKNAEVSVTQIHGNRVVVRATGKT